MATVIVIVLNLAVYMYSFGNEYDTGLHLTAYYRYNYEKCCLTVAIKLWLQKIRGEREKIFNFQTSLILWYIFYLFYHQ